MKAYTEKEKYTELENISNKIENIDLTLKELVRVMKDLTQYGMGSVQYEQFPKKGFSEDPASKETGFDF